MNLYAVLLPPECNCGCPATAESGVCDAARSCQTRHCRTTCSFLGMDPPGGTSLTTSGVAPQRWPGAREDRRPSLTDAPSRRVRTVCRSADVVRQCSGHVDRRAIHVHQDGTRVYERAKRIDHSSSRRRSRSTRDVEDSIEGDHSSSRAHRPTTRDVEYSIEGDHSSSRAHRPTTRDVQSFIDDVRSSSRVYSPTTRDVRDSIDDVHSSSGVHCRTTRDVRDCIDDVHSSSRVDRPSMHEVQC